MALFVLFLFGIANFAMQKAVLESHHPLLGQLPWYFHMLGGQQSGRSILHLSELFRLADAARVLRDPDLAAARMADVLRVAGVSA